MKWMTSFERVGYEKGKVESFEEGIEEGVTKVAANLIAAGQSNAFITEVTGLSDAEIDKLRTMHQLN